MGPTATYGPMIKAAPKVIAAGMLGAGGIADMVRRRQPNEDLPAYLKRFLMGGAQVAAVGATGKGMLQQKAAQDTAVNYRYSPQPKSTDIPIEDYHRLAGPIHYAESIPPRPSPPPSPAVPVTVGLIPRFEVLSSELSGEPVASIMERTWEEMEQERPGTLKKSGVGSGVLEQGDKIHDSTGDIHKVVGFDREGNPQVEHVSHRVQLAEGGHAYRAPLPEEDLGIDSIMDGRLPRSGRAAYLPEGHPENNMEPFSDYIRRNSHVADPRSVEEGGHLADGDIVHDRYGLTYFVEGFDNQGRANLRPLAHPESGRIPIGPEDRFHWNSTDVTMRRALNAEPLQRTGDLSRERVVSYDPHNHEVLVDRNGEVGTIQGDAKMIAQRELLKAHADLKKPVTLPVQLIQEQQKGRTPMAPVFAPATP
jgi:hypothetical protein